jgi:hypothetical protein
MPTHLVKEGVSIEALGLLLLVVLLPIVYLKWFDVALLQPKKVDPKYQIQYRMIITETPQAPGMINGIKINVGGVGITPQGTMAAVLASDTPTPSQTVTQLPTVAPGDLNYKLPVFGSYEGKEELTRSIRIKISWYWPPDGGINCDGHLSDCKHMASGELWEDMVGRAAACPTEIPFGSEISFEGYTWVCMDRGGAIVRVDDGAYWIDLLYPWVSEYSFGQEIDAVTNNW